MHARMMNTLQLITPPSWRAFIMPKSVLAGGGAACIGKFPSESRKSCSGDGGYSSRQVTVALVVDVTPFPLESWAGLYRPRALAIRQVASLKVAVAPLALQPVTRPFGPTVSWTVTVPVSLLSAALGG